MRTKTYQLKGKTYLIREVGEDSPCCMCGASGYDEEWDVRITNCSVETEQSCAADVKK
jgi:hypothetical protein